MTRTNKDPNPLKPTRNDTCMVEFLVSGFDCRETLCPSLESRASLASFVLLSRTTQNTPELLVQHSPDVRTFGNCSSIWSQSYANCSLFPPFLSPHNLTPHFHPLLCHFLQFQENNTNQNELTPMHEHPWRAVVCLRYRATN
jgi:hypothetical protein